MTMTFHISEALLIERTLFVSSMILIFGFMSIGGLYLLRRRMMPARSSASSWQDVLALSGKDEAETIARVLERLSRSGRVEIAVHEPQTQTHQEVEPSTRE
jgi:hypothetical protein